MLKANEMLKLSYDMVPGDPSPDGIPGAEVIPYKDIEHDGGNVRLLRTTSHTGTHVDSPNHMLEEGQDIFAFRQDEFLFDAPLFVSIPLGDDEMVDRVSLEPFADRLAKCDFLIICTGWTKVRAENSERYAKHSPGFSISGAEFIAQFPNIRAVGADFLSFAAPEHVKEGVEAHKVMMRANPRIQLYEDMYLPDEVHDRTVSQILTVPWLFGGADSAPCTIYAISG